MTLFMGEIHTIRHVRASARKHRAAQIVNHVETVFVDARDAQETLTKARAYFHTKTKQGTHGQVNIIGSMDSIDQAIVRCQSRRALQAKELYETDARLRAWQVRRQKIMAELGVMG